MVPYFSTATSFTINFLLTMNPFRSTNVDIAIMNNFSSRRVWASPRCLPSFEISRRNSWRVSSVVAQISFSHYGLCALERLFKGANLRAVTKCISCYVLLIFECLSAEQLQYRRSYFYTCTATTSNTSGTNVRNTWRQIQRFDPIVAATSTTISHGRGRTWTAPHLR